MNGRIVVLLAVTLAACGQGSGKNRSDGTLVHNDPAQHGSGAAKGDGPAARSFGELKREERWSQKAELEVSAGLYEEAFETLVKVEDALIGGGHVQEYIRVGRLLFESIDWETAPSSIRDLTRSWA